jgi:metallo-beta-lactamase family protein
MEMTLQFLGAAQNVTGSRYLLKANGQQLLVDCGLYQERQFKSRNWEPLPVPADKIDAVLLTHAHLDHCGLLPKLYKERFRGPVHCTRATADIARIVMTDSARIQVEDVEHKKKRHARQNRQSPYPLEPLYTVEDAEGCATLFAGTRYHQTVTVAEGIEATYYDTGHILGAAAIRVKVTQKGESRSVLFSGDVGRCDKPILKDPEPIDQADYVLCESTYGDRQHPAGGDIKILGETHLVRARIAQIQGFSAHADRDELTRWLSPLKKTPRHLFVVHGEVNAAHYFADHVKKNLGWNTSIPQHGDEETLS